MTNDNAIIFPAEWYPQSGVMLTWPHENTDWRNILDEVIPCYVNIAKEIVKREKLLIVCKNIEDVKKALGDIDYKQIIFHEMETNDTWARDHAPISIFAYGHPFICDFTFNGWGLKFAANFDNQITQKLFASQAFTPAVRHQNMMHCVLEGGSIESDGCGTILTTSECLLSKNRNEYKDKSEIDEYLKMMFGAKQILWLDYGYLAGDDTDSHIDTLARFCDSETIAYIKCDDKDDEHYEALSSMEKQLASFKTLEGKPYRLIPLPMADAVYDNENRLPATYANFLIINDAVLFPTYNSYRDEIAKQQLQQAFPEREIIGINSLPLIKQHGSLHCISMQFPKNFIL